MARWSDFGDYLTVSQLADILQLPRSTAYDLIHRPGFPLLRLGRIVRIPKDAAMKWLGGSYVGDTHSDSVRLASWD